MFYAAKPNFFNQLDLYEIAFIDFFTSPRSGQRDCMMPEFVSLAYNDGRFQDKGA